MKLKGSEIICESLLREGVEVLFGHPGGAILPFYDALWAYPQLRHILVRHEQSAAHAADGTIANGRIFAEEKGDNGKPDGMKVDKQGNLYVTGPNGIWVFASDGTHLGIILVPERCANLAWGGDEWKSLFITASTSVYRVECKAEGIAVS